MQSYEVAQGIERTGDEMSDRIIIETNGKRYVAKDFVGPLAEFNGSVRVGGVMCCPKCGCPRTWIPVNEIDPPHPTSIRELADEAVVAKRTPYGVVKDMEKTNTLKAFLNYAADVIERAIAERDTALVLGHPSIASSHGRSCPTMKEARNEDT